MKMVTVPNYIFEKKNNVRLILLTAFFALIFINIYKPFGSQSWYHVSSFKFFVFSSLLILTGMLVVVISRIILCKWGKKHPLSLGSYFVWIALEIFFMSLIYTVYTVLLNPDRDYIAAFNVSVENTSLVLLLPYAVLHLYFAYQEKERKLREIEEHESEAVQRLNIFNFYDEKGDFRLSVSRENLLYLESSDNYVCIWYLNKGQLTRYMLRNSLKTLEENFGNSNVIRCHRSYMVNFDQVKVIRREKDGVFIELGTPGVPGIPISRSYSEKVSHLFIDNPQ